jgi:hypothetical protein
MQLIALTLSLLIALSGCSRHAQSTSSSSSIASSDAMMKPTEGMWLFDALPTERLQRFDFTPTQGWADHVRLSSVRIDGGSGAFISGDGLILTNHHIAAGGLANISTAQRDLVGKGFLANSLDQEIMLPGYEARVLMSIEDVTDRVNAAVDPKLPAADAVKARHAAFANITRESEQKTGLQSNIVELFGGARYHLYRTKRYTDIRAVFAPEFSIAFFGGDPDNFEYPRYDLDISILRAYENGKPAHIEHYLKLAPKGVGDGDLVFVSGNPGHTDRLLPVSTLLTHRHLTLPLHVQTLERLEKAVQAYEARGPEEHRQGQDDEFGIQNSLKALRPRLAALRGDIIDQKKQQEDAFRAMLRQRPDLKHYDAAFDRAQAANQREREIYMPISVLEWGYSLDTQLFSYARTLVRLPVERAKPDADRLPEFAQSGRAAMEHRLLADEPLYPELEIAKLTASLQFMADQIGQDSPLAQKILAGKSPADRARELIAGSKLGDVNERKRLMTGGADAVNSSDDAMIVLARSIDAEARKVRQEYEAQVDEPLTQAMTDINRARFALFGNRIYPDATFTLRLAFGLVEGYEQEGQQIAPWTTMGGAFEHEQKHEAKPPYKLPQSWEDAKDKMAATTPLNFVCTADITGGNSGSPVINRAGEWVGVIFDSNRQGVTNDLQFTDRQARAVCVDSRAIVESLRHVYGAEKLTEEITATSASAFSPSSPSPGTPGEGWGGGSRRAESKAFSAKFSKLQLSKQRSEISAVLQTPSLTLPRNSGGGNKGTCTGTGGEIAPKLLDEINPSPNAVAPNAANTFGPVEASGLHWLHLSSKNGDLAVPGASTEQTGALVADLDKNGVNDFVLSFRQKAPALVWYRRKKDGWDRYVIDKDYLTVEAGGVAYDIDGDGLPDLVFGADWQGADLWWWKNPGPPYDANVSWKRYTIKNSGGHQHHDQIIGDFKGTGRPQLVYWNQGARKLFIADIPANPTQVDQWPATEVITGTAGENPGKYAEGVAAADMDSDGRLDLLAGNYWFKYIGNNQFKATRIGQIGGRIAAAHLIKDSKYPQVVIASGDGVGPLMWYECKGDPTDAKSWVGHDLLGRDMVHGHTLQIADIDGDGNLDIFTAEMSKWTEKRSDPDNPNAEAFIFFGDGQGHFRKTVFAKGIGFHEARVADLNGDGLMDILDKPYNWDVPRVDVWLQTK